MKLGEIVVHMGNYNFTKFHQNQMKNKFFFINSPFFCSEFQSVSRIVKFVDSVPEFEDTQFCLNVTLFDVKAMEIHVKSRKVFVMYIKYTEAC